MIKTTVK